MLICRNCGSPLPDTARFCGECGVKVTSTHLALPITLRLLGTPTDRDQSDTPIDLDLPVTHSRSFKSIRMFISYAQRDQKLLDRLEEHLSNLKYRGLITTWTAKKMKAGEEVIQQVDVQLNTAHVILLLVSASFFASEDCYREMMWAMQRHQRGGVDVIPVLLRRFAFTGAPFAKLKPLPTNGRPVTSWRNRDEAFFDIATGIERVVQERLEGPTLRSAYVLSHRRTAVGGCLGILLITGLITSLIVLLVKSPTLALFLGIIVGSLVLLTGILLAFRALVENIRDRRARAARRRAQKQAYYEEALRAYEQALRQNNADATAYRGKGNALVGLERYEAALVAFTQAVALMPLPLTYVHMGDVLTILRHYDEAVASYQQALALDASYASAYTGMREAFLKLGKVPEAKQAYQQAKRLDGND